ncbi:MAG: (2Fe-2S)-binding protein [Thermomicrobiales bacterium]
MADHQLLGAPEPRPDVRFTFDGRPVVGREGEPVAVALLAAGCRVFRTMPRFGDARGGYCMAGRCADCLVIVNGVPNVAACVTPVAVGLDVRTQHGHGQVDEMPRGEIVG